jgi:hypothetical protein
MTAQLTRIRELRISDPFEMMQAVENNAPLAAELLGITLPELYRQLDEDKGRVARGLMVKRTLEWDALLSDYQQALRDRTRLRRGSP